MAKKAGQTVTQIRKYPKTIKLNRKRKPQRQMRVRKASRKLALILVMKKMVKARRKSITE